ncbi:hypothetical protein IQ13_0300 [Lacibacter cauensis]|uniref:Uncharacterized protein n=1 Tax=Lacibacter cauensis TaxID=510947 RepID=A0A562SVE5_9BACT|nr:hypothetical protein [Lacibacter cauensis]TWI85143.1 hypothetical protein IQ13_0300 [Lacibacter cauensis]
MKKYLTGIFAAGLLLSACEKKVNPVDTYYVTVEYKQNTAKDLTGNVELNPKDSIYLNFTISSPNDMAYIEIQRNGSRIDTFQLNTADKKRSFSTIKGYRADSAAGVYTYRVLARDARGVFMGDGGKQLKVTVKPDFDFWSYRILQVPDSLTQTNKCYYSTKDGKVYSYADGPGNSASIDFGYYWDTTGRGTASTTDDLKHCLYALNAPQSQIAFNDVSQTSWTKNATLLKKMPSSVNFVTGLTSSGAIQTLIGGNMTSGTSSKVTAINTTAGNNVIGFRTVTGKFGAILIRFLNGDSPSKTTQIEVDVKVQK